MFFRPSCPSALHSLFPRTMLVYQVCYRILKFRNFSLFYVIGYGFKCRNKNKPAKLPKKKDKLSKSRVVKVTMPIAESYPLVKVMARWSLIDPSNPRAPPMFCLYVPLVVVAPET